MKIFNPIRLAIFLALTLLVSACTPALQQLDRAGDLGSGEIVIAGRIELVPHLGKNEQVLGAYGADQYRNKAIFVIGDKPVDIYDFDGSSLDVSALVEFNRDFHIRVPRRTNLIYSGSIIVAEAYGNGASSFIYLPGRLNIKVGRNDKALYIGTLRFYRSDFNEIKKVVVVDSYASFNERFKKRFGSRIKLKKARLGR